MTGTSVVVISPAASDAGKKVNPMAKRKILTDIVKLILCCVVVWVLIDLREDVKELQWHQRTLRGEYCSNEGNELSALFDEYTKKIEQAEKEGADPQEVEQLRLTQDNILLQQELNLQAYNLFLDSLEERLK